MIWEVSALAIVFLAAFLLGFLVYFHRVPVRNSPAEPRAIIAPADGVIWQIISLQGETELEIHKQFLGRIRTLASDVENAACVVSIFMNPLDVHVNWSPVDGKIVYVKHTPGNFSFANTWKSLWNEKNEILFDAEGFQLKMIQIAGFLARRIVCDAKEGETVGRGAKIGMIRLGSQVSLILPRGVKLRVKTGQRVSGGETIVGVFEP